MFHAALKTYMFVNETVAKNGNTGRKTWRDMLNIYSALPTASAWLDPPQYMLACPTLWGNMFWFTT